MRLPRKIAKVIFTTLLFATCVAHGHPEDEFCTPGEDGLDPALCAALAELNMAESDVNQAELQPLLDASGEERGFWSTFGLYIKIGIGHILPGGADHILFVLAIFLASTKLRSRSGSCHGAGRSMMRCSSAKRLRSW